MSAQPLERVEFHPDLTPEAARHLTDDQWLALMARVPASRVAGWAFPADGPGPARVLVLDADARHGDDGVLRHVMRVDPDGAVYWEEFTADGLAH